MGIVYRSDGTGLSHTTTFIIVVIAVVISLAITGLGVYMKRKKEMKQEEQQRQLLEMLQAQNAHLGLAMPQNPNSIPGPQVATAPPIHQAAPPTYPGHA